MAQILAAINCALLERKARDLADAGLGRVTVSLDSLDDNVFMATSLVGTMSGDRYMTAPVTAGPDMDSPSLAAAIFATWQRHN